MFTTAADTESLATSDSRERSEPSEQMNSHGRDPGHLGSEGQGDWS